MPFKEIFLDYKHPLIINVSDVLSESSNRVDLIQYGIDSVKEIN